MKRKLELKAMKVSINHKVLICLVFFNSPLVLSIIYNHMVQGCDKYKTYEYCVGQSAFLSHAEKQDYAWFRVNEKEKPAQLKNTVFDQDGYEIKNDDRHSIEGGSLRIKELVPTDHALYFYKRKFTTILECPNYRLNVYGLRSESNSLSIKIKQGDTAVLGFYSNIPETYNPKDSKIYKMDGKVMFDGNNGNTGNYKLESKVKRIPFQYMTNDFEKYKYSVLTYTALTIHDIQKKQEGVWKSQWQTNEVCPKKISSEVVVHVDDPTSKGKTTDPRTITTTPTIIKPNPKKTSSGASKAVASLCSLCMAFATIFAIWKFYLQKKLDDDSSDEKTEENYRETTQKDVVDTQRVLELPGGGGASDVPNTMRSSELEESALNAQSIPGGQPPGIQKQMSIPEGGQQGIQAPLEMNGAQPAGIQKQISIPGGGQQGIQAPLEMNGAQPAGIQKQISIPGGGQQGIGAPFAISGGQPEGIQKQMSIPGGGQQGIRGPLPMNGGQMPGIRNQMPIQGGGQQGVRVPFAINGGQTPGIRNRMPMQGGGQQGIRAPFAINGGQTPGIRNRMPMPMQGGGQQGIRAPFAINGGQTPGIRNRMPMQGAGQQGIRAPLAMNGGQPPGIRNQMPM